MTTIPLFKVFMSKDVLEPLNNVLMSGFISQGNQVEIFEKKLIDYFENPFLLTLNSATSGLTLALRLLINPNEENNWISLSKNLPRENGEILRKLASKISL